MNETRVPGKAPDVLRCGHGEPIEVCADGSVSPGVVIVSLFDGRSRFFAWLTLPNAIRYAKGILREVERNKEKTS